MKKSKNLEKLVLSTLFAGSMVIGSSVFAATLEESIDFSERGEATPITYKFDGKDFVHARFYTDGSITSSDEGTTILRPLFVGEQETISKSLNYWYGVLGTPATVPYIDVYLGETQDFSAAAGSDPDAAGELTKLAKSFQDKNDSNPDSFDAAIFVNQPEKNKKYYIEKLDILPTNGADMNYPATLVHELFHALGISTSFQAKIETGNENVPVEIPTSTFTRFEQNIYDFRGTKLKDCDKMAIIESPEEATDAKTFYFIKKSDAGQFDEGFNGVYYKGEHVENVLDLNGQEAKIAWANDFEFAPVAGIPINGVEASEDDTFFNVELSHFELQNSLQSHQNYRNWGIPM